jgi:hypothetical protein
LNGLMMASIFFMWTSRAGCFALVVPVGTSARRVEKSNDCGETSPRDEEVAGH